MMSMNPLPNVLIKQMKAIGLIRAGIKVSVPLLLWANWSFHPGVNSFVDSSTKTAFLYSRLALSCRNGFNCHRSRVCRGRGSFDIAERGSVIFVKFFQRIILIN
jgi:hypothetical protein